MEPKDFLDFFHQAASDHGKKVSAKPVIEHNEQVKGKILDILKKIKGNQKEMEALQQTNPKAYQSMLAMTQAMVQMAKQYMVQPEEGVQKSEPEFGEPLDKNIGFLLFPKMGIHNVPTAPYTASGVRAEKIHNREGPLKSPQEAAGQMASSRKVVVGEPVEPQRRVTFGHARAGEITMPRGTVGQIGLHGTAEHEAQHSVFQRMAQMYGPEVPINLAKTLFNSLSNHEKKALKMITSRSGYVPDSSAKYDRFFEEAICTLQNYLQDKPFRDAVHADLSLPAITNEKEAGVLRPKGHPLVVNYPNQGFFHAESLHSTAKKIWSQLMAKAPRIVYKDRDFYIDDGMDKSELQKALHHQHRLNIPSGTTKQGAAPIPRAGETGVVSQDEPNKDGQAGKKRHNRQVRSGLTTNPENGMPISVKEVPRQENDGAKPPKG